ncbi:MAG: hypothetical protein LBQ24_05385 [Candidatus Peribacteria bacterium]|jgi:hypothetical protein|nr:hypothetical protein [Candidatus Peribacteria bacterium]
METKFANFKNLYKTKKTVRFSLLDLNTINKNNIEKKDYLEINFLIHMLSHEKELLNINDFSNTKLFQSQI